MMMMMHTANLEPRNLVRAGADLATFPWNSWMLVRY